MLRSAERPQGRTPIRLAGRYALVLALVAALNVGGAWLVGQFDFTIVPSTSDLAYRLMIVAAAAYVLTMAVPFVPGIEIGLAIMLMTGPTGVAFVYACTLLALALAFLVGRYVPLAALRHVFAWLHLERAARWITRLDACPPAERIDSLLDVAPQPWLRRLLRHRYLAAAVLLNLPGNALIGGAGGIAMVAGMSRLFRLPRFIATMAIAITPVPLLLLATR